MDNPDAEELPRIVGEAMTDAASAAGSVWRLDPPRRGLDANVIALPGGDEIAVHDGPDLDVLLMVLAGSGRLETADGEIALDPHVLVWLPPRSRRRIVAGPDGLRYFSVHGRKPGLSIGSRPPATRPGQE